MEQRLAIVYETIDDLIFRLDRYISGEFSAEFIYEGSADGVTDNDMVRGLEQLVTEKRYAELAEAWVNGSFVPWSRVYKINNETPKRISLPTYPFAKDSFWIGAGMKRSTAGSKDDIEKHQLMYYRRVWRHRALDQQQEYHKDVIIFDQSDEVYREYERNSLCPIMVKPGRAFKRVDERIFEINPKREHDYDRLLVELKAINVEPKHIIYLWMRGEGAKDRLKVASRVLERGVHALFYLSRALTRGWFKGRVKTICVYDDNDSLYGVYSKAISGFAKAVKLENPKLVCQTIGLAHDSSSAYDVPSICGIELSSNVSDDTDVRYSEAGREVRVIEGVDDLRLEKQIPLKQAGVYLITGGLGGLGFLLAKYLAKKYSARLILTGRRDLGDDGKSKLSDIAEVGGEVLYVRADVSKQKDVKKLISESKKKFSRINGVVHAAGMLDDKLLLNKDKKSFDSVISPKVKGVINLDEAAKDEDLDFFMMFSSIAAVTGNVGQCDYAYGNSFMDEYSFYRNELVSSNKRRGVSVSVNWPLWQSGGMRVDEELARMQEKIYGIYPISTEDGLMAFEEAFRLEETPIVVLSGVKRKIDELFGLAESIDDGKGATSYDLGGKNVEEIEDKLRELISSIIKIDADKVDTHADLGKYGVDSIVMMQIMMRIREEFGNVEINPSVVVENPTIIGVAEYLMSQGVEKDIGGSEGQSARGVMGNSSSNAKSHSLIELEVSHPFIDSAARSRDNEILATKSFSLHSDPLIRDHVIVGTPRMMGVGFVEMMYSAAFFGELPINNISDVVLINPISLEEDTICESEIRIRKGDDGSYDMQIASNVDGELYRNAAAKGRELPLEKKFISLPILEDGLLGAEPFDYQLLNRDKRVHIGPYFYAENQISIAGNKCFVRIDLSKKAKEMNHSFLLHVGLLDPCVYFSVALVYEKLKAAEQYVYLPIYFEEITVHSPVNEQCYALIELRDELEQIDEKKMLSFDISYYSDEGELLTYVKGLKLKKVV